MEKKALLAGSGLPEETIDAIQAIVKAKIEDFAKKIEDRHLAEKNDPRGVINAKKNNCFIAEMGSEFIFYSAFVRSFDSSFGHVLEDMGNAIAALTYEVRHGIDSYLLPQQNQQIDYMMTEYDTGVKPEVGHYAAFTCMVPKDLTSYKVRHETDHYFYNPEKREHYIMELKAGGDLDNKKAKAEKQELLKEYFELKNKLQDNGERVSLYLATAYNMFGEGKEWRQERVRKYFAQDELLIGRAYWDFICGSPMGYEIVFSQYQESCAAVKAALERVRKTYLTGE